LAPSSFGGAWTPFSLWTISFGAGDAELELILTTIHQKHCWVREMKEKRRRMRIYAIMRKTKDSAGESKYSPRVWAVNFYEAATQGNKAASFYSARRFPVEVPPNHCTCHGC
jgi:hypothetical protein